MTLDVCCFPKAKPEYVKTRKCKFIMMPSARSEKHVAQSIRMKFTSQIK